MIEKAATAYSVRVCNRMISAYDTHPLSPTHCSPATDPKLLKYVSTAEADTTHYYCWAGPVFSSWWSVTSSTAVKPKTHIDLDARIFADSPQLAGCTDFLTPAAVSSVSTQHYSW